MKTLWNYCVVSRSGTKKKFQWHRTPPLTENEARIYAAQLESWGNVAHVVNYNQSVSIGLPETFEPPKQKRSSRA